MIGGYERGNRQVTGCYITHLTLYINRCQDYNGCGILSDLLVPHKIEADSTAPPAGPLAGHKDWDHMLPHPAKSLVRARTAWLATGFAAFACPAGRSQPGCDAS